MQLDLNSVKYIGREGFIRMFCIYVSISFFITKEVYAQDTVSLKMVEINASKNNLLHTGNRKEKLDSLIKEQFRFSSVADLLSLNSQVYIKSYGPGALATTAFRGGSANHTAILWNGFNLQNAMLGQTDLSVLPAVLFEQVEIEHGGSSALWGSGAVAGSIQLNNLNLFGQGLKTVTHLGTGSFGFRSGATALSFSNGRLAASTKLYLTHSENNFAYRVENSTQRQRHAAYSFAGVLQELKYLISAKQLITVNVWANNNNRQLPPVYSQPESKSSQYDGALRVTAAWTIFKSKLKSAQRVAYFNERINYNDSLLKIFSKSKVQTLIAESDNYLTIGRRYHINFGVSYTGNTAFTGNYYSIATLQRVSALVGNKVTILSNRLTIYALGRAEYFSSGNQPLTGNIAVNCTPINALEISINAARVYRHPTLNELYWVPGGNKNLLPEQGYSLEGNAVYKKEVNRVSVSLAGSLYSRHIQNWILWVPGAGGNPSPVNIQEVWSRGSEATCKLNYIKNKFKIGFNFMSAYVLSTVVANAQQNSDVQGRQLIYTPRYSINTGLHFTYSKFYTGCFYNYTGYRFTTGDNTAWLPPYQITSWRVGYQMSYYQTSLSMYLACNNLFNSSYETLVARPMPLRSFEFGITIKTTHNKQQNKTK